MKKGLFTRNRYLFILDIIGYFIAFFITTFLATSPSRLGIFMEDYFIPYILSTLMFLAISLISGIHRIMWRYCTVKDGAKLVKTGIIGFFLSFAIFFCYSYIRLRLTLGSEYVIKFGNLLGYIKIAFCNGFLSSCVLIFVRAMVHILYKYAKYRNASTDKPSKRLLIVGAGYSANIVIHDISRNVKLNYDIVGLVDDDPAKKKCTIGGYKVLGDRYDIEKICKDYKVDEILMAMPSATTEQRREIISICSKTDCKLKTLPSIDQMIGDGKFSMRDVEIDDLLERDEIHLDNNEISEYIENKVVLVTGGGGSIGSELCRQIMKFNPRTLVVLDIYENNAYDLQMELNEKYPQNKPDVVIASVRDIDRIKAVFDTYKPEIVFHAAAHKHVPLMENSPSEAIKNNVLGTYNVVKCADECGCRKFVMISTDKAVNPTNIMGATKRMCEMIVKAMQGKSKTEFVSVRFGNVLNSNGSVIPLFKRQIEKGGPVTITHKEITRFFMTIPEAAQLVMQAGAYAKGGEVFVLDMGKPVKIYDLAKNLIKLSGYKPDVDIEIKEIGLRPGEKLYEELLMDEEGLTSTSHSKIFIGRQSDVELEEIEKNIETLLDAAETQDKEKIRKALHDAVPTFKEPEVVNSVVMTN